AADAVQAADGLLHRHPLHQAGDPLKVPVASAHEFHMADGAVLGHLDADIPGADAPGGIAICHHTTVLSDGSSSAFFRVRPLLYPGPRRFSSSAHPGTSPVHLAAAATAAA